MRGAAKHTPGPWTVVPWTGVVHGAGAACSKHDGMHEAVWAGDLLICPTGLVGWTQSLDNARLIAAAPELLEVVREHAEWCVKNGVTAPPAKRAIEALAKATGEA